ncbi:MAG TPA: hypothetical protein VLL57_02665, partial [Candidatus Binataceae bacterium]|nr:hypothetical protein [Candidatus Binataceae bacterium]
MAEAQREIDHRFHLHNLAAPEIIGGSEREQRNQDAGGSGDHEQQITASPGAGRSDEPVETRLDFHARFDAVHPRVPYGFVF